MSSTASASVSSHANSTTMKGSSDTFTCTCFCIYTWAREVRTRAGSGSRPLRVTTLFAAFIGALSMALSFIFLPGSPFSFDGPPIAPPGRHPHAHRCAA
jgi:hypothetical protein